MKETKLVGGKQNRKKAVKQARSGAGDKAWPLHPQEFKVVSLRQCRFRDERPLLDTPKTAAAYWREHIATEARFNPHRESAVLLLLNTRRRLLGHVTLAHGTKDTVFVDAGEALRPAVLAGATAVVLMHNHPSGDPTPSEPDIEVTRNLMRAGDVLKVELIDHVIMGKPASWARRDYCSLKELGYMDGTMEPAARRAAEGKRKEAVADYLAAIQFVVGRMEIEQLKQCNAEVFDADLSVDVKNIIYTALDAALEKKMKAGAAGEVKATAAKPEAAASAPGWAEQHRLVPGVRQEVAEEKEGAMGSAEEGWKLPLLGLAGANKFTVEELHAKMLDLLADTHDLLAFTVLPRLTTACDVVEFAEMLWLVQASHDCGHHFGKLGEIAGERMGWVADFTPSREKLLAHFMAVLREQADAITRYALPKATARHAADLAEGLAIADLLKDLSPSPWSKRMRQAARSGGALQQQACELRARAWMENDAWRFTVRSDFQSGQYDKLACAKPVAA